MVNSASRISSMSLEELADYILEHWGEISIQSLTSHLSSKIRRSKPRSLLNFARKLLRDANIARKVLSGISEELLEIVAKRKMLILALYLYAINVRGFTKPFINDILSQVRIGRVFDAIEDDFIVNNRRSFEVVCRFLELALVGARRIEDIITEIRFLNKVWTSSNSDIFLDTITNVLLGIRTRVKRYTRSILLKFSRAVIYSIACCGALEPLKKFIRNIEQILPLDEIIRGCIYHDEYLAVGVILLYYFKRGEFEERFNEIVEGLKKAADTYYPEEIIVCLARHPEIFDRLLVEAKDLLNELLLKIYEQNPEEIGVDLKFIKTDYKKLFEESLIHAMAKNPFIIDNIIDILELSKSDIDGLEEKIIHALREGLTARKIVPCQLLPIDGRGILRGILRRVLSLSLIHI